MNNINCNFPLQPLPLLPVIGKFDLTTYVPGSSDYEIMARVIETYNSAVALFNQLLSEYSNIEETLNAYKEEQDKKIDAIDEKTTQEINDIDTKFTTEIRNMKQKYDSDMLKLNQTVTKLRDDLNFLLDGGVIEIYVKALSEWIDNNLQILVGKIVKYVWFDLTDDGYFRAYIPDMWNFVNFDTELNMDDPDYGKLRLDWIPELGN